MSRKKTQPKKNVVPDPKFKSTDYIPVPADWETNSDDSAVRDNAVDGSIKIVTISNAGVGIGTADAVYTKSSY